LQKVSLLRTYIPDIAITTDIMVGFPGETEQDFEDTIDLVKKVGFAGAFTFIYSKRSGTPASTMPNQVSEDVATKRIVKLIDIQNSFNRDQSKLYQGKTVEILCEGFDEKKQKYLGRDTYGRMAYFSSETNLIGQFVDVKITKTGGISLLGELVAKV
jgi:tRNA-2-methylthio-N6-dimethylallyladenosine synthase